MNNKGRIVVFMSLMTAVFLILITVCMQICIQSAAKSKTVIAAKLTVSDIKAEYNRYVFDHYHILLFDKTAGGKGEAYLEEKMEAYFSEKLGDEYGDTQVKITEFIMLCDNGCEAFKQQIRDSSVYLLAQEGAGAGVDMIVEQTEGMDGTMPEDLEEDMQEAEEERINGEQQEHQNDDSDQTAAEEADGDAVLASLEDEEDPRDYTKQLSSSAILNLVLPDDDKTVSSAVLETDELPSFQLGGWFSDYQEIDRDFDGMGSMIFGLQALGSWQDALTDGAAQAVYTSEVFNSYLEEKNDTAVLAYEQEYLIAGQRSDYENLKSVAHRMIGIRFPINYISLCGQSDKMTKVTAIATAVAGIAPYMIPVLKYLIAGCWAYVESIADVRILFDGKKAPFMKTSENWITDIEHIGDSLTKETVEDDNGLDYQAYLTILQLMHAEGTRNRMLDLIQENTRQEYPEFAVRNAAVAVEADFETDFRDMTYRFHQTGQY